MMKKCIRCEREEKQLTSDYLCNVCINELLLGNEPDTSGGQEYDRK